jgi:hypothetical protein
MICRDFDRLCNDAIDARDGESSMLERVLERHAAECPSCRAIAERYQTLRQAIRALGPPPLPPANFAARLLEQRGVVPMDGASRARRVGVWSGMAAAAALLVAGLLAFRGLPSGRPPAVPAAPDLAARPLTDALADATSATLDLARSASGPAARIGGEVLRTASTAEGPSALPAMALSGPSSEMLQRMGDRINAGVRPLSGTARQAFGFLLAPTPGDRKPARGPHEGA